MKLYIAAKIGQYKIGYAEFTVSSSYEQPFDCIENSMVEEGSDIIIVSGGRYINGIVTDKTNRKMNIIQEGNVELLEKLFKIIK